MPNFLIFFQTHNNMYITYKIRFSLIEKAKRFPNIKSHFGTSKFLLHPGTQFRQNIDFFLAKKCVMFAEHYYKPAKCQKQRRLPTLPPD